MEQLIRELNVPANQGAPERINEIQKQIQHLQREKTAWQLGLAFLHHSDALIRFYGALTLTIKINADWENDNFGTENGMKDSLLEAVVSSYVRLTLAGDANFVLQKLCSTLTALQQRLGSYWHLPLRHIVACLAQQGFVQQQSLPELRDIIIAASHTSASQLTSAVRFATTLIEDSSTPDSMANDPATAQLSASCLDVFQLLSYCMTSFCYEVIDVAPHNSLSDGTLSLGSDLFPVDLAHLCLQAVPLWITQLKTQATHAPKSELQATNHAVVQCIKRVLKCVEHDALTSAALQSLISIQQSSPRMLTRAEPGFPQSLGNLATVRNLVKALRDGDFSPEGVLLVDLLEAIMAQVDLSSPQYILSGDYAETLHILLGLLKCDGIAMVEDTTCQVALETIVMIIEGYTDWDDDSDCDGQALKYLKGFVQEACESCLTKIRLPSAQMNDATQSWDADDRACFHDFRMDVQDFLQSAFTILGSTLVEAIVHTVLRDTSEVSWPDFEASLFCLIAFSDTMTAEPERYDPLVEATLDSDYFKLVIQSPTVPDKARNTSIRFLTEMTAYLQRYPHLMQMLNFLFSSLHQPSLVSSASRAIYTLCDAQRSFLTPALPSFLASLGTVADLHGIERHRIYGGVAAVVQALPDDTAKVEPLLTILNCVSQAADRAGTNDPEEPRIERLSDVLQTLAAVGRGLRAPNDALVDLGSYATATDTFWTNGSGSAVQQQALGIYKHLLNISRGGADGEFIEAACDFLRSGFTEEHPAPLKFSSAVSTELVTVYISLNSPNIDSVMGCASSLLASSHRTGFEPFLAQLLQQVMKCAQELVTDLRSGHTLSDSNFPSASLDFVSRLLPKWVETILGMHEGQSFLDLFVQIAVLVISEPDTLPRRSAASFFSALVDVSKPGKTLNEAVRHRLHAQIQHHSPAILAALLRLIGGECARSELEVLTDPLRRFVLHQPMLFKNICREAMQDKSGILSPKALQVTTLEQRLRFIAQMEALRGGRRSNDVVKEFWIACRGSGFGYIA